MTLGVIGYDFEGPYLKTDDIRNEAGVYLVTRKNTDGKYKIIDVGETDTLKTRLAGHDRKDCWAKYVTFPIFWVLYTSDKAEVVRRKIEKGIREKYKPDCGER